MKTTTIIRFALCSITGLTLIGATARTAPAFADESAAGQDVGITRSIDVVESAPGLGGGSVEVSWDLNAIAVEMGQRHIDGEDQLGLGFERGE